MSSLNFPPDVLQPQEYRRGRCLNDIYFWGGGDGLETFPVLPFFFFKPCWSFKYVHVNHKLPLTHTLHPLVTIISFSRSVESVSVLIN